MFKKALTKENRDGNIKITKTVIVTDFAKGVKRKLCQRRHEQK